MIRKPKHSTFWIVFLSLNLIPLVAQGGGGEHKDKPPAGKGAQGQKPTPPPGKKPAEAKKDPKKDPKNNPPPPPTYEGEAKDLKFEDLRGSVMDFDYTRLGSNPNLKVELDGRIYTDCARFLEIDQLTSVPGCKGAAGAFRVRDTGGFAACMEEHKGEKCVEARQPKTPMERLEAMGKDPEVANCQFLSDMENAKLDATNLGDGEIVLSQRNPNGNKNNQNTCESFPTVIAHISKSTLDSESKSRRDKELADRRSLAERQLRQCRGSSEKLAIAAEACQTMVSLGAYTSEEDCWEAQSLDRDMLRSLRQSADQAPVSELGAIAESLIDWATEHEKDCKATVESLRTIARRLVGQKIKRTRRDREEEVDALAGYDEAIAIFESALESESCLADSDKLADMHFNLLANRNERNGEINGMNNQEFLAEYSGLQEMGLENYQFACGGWEMQPNCGSAMQGLQTVGMIPQQVYKANMQQAQSRMALMQMASMSMQQPGMMGGQMGGMPGMFGGSMMGGSMMGGFGGGMPNSFGFGGGAGSGYGFGRL